MSTEGAPGPDERLRAGSASGSGGFLAAQACVLAVAVIGLLVFGWAGAPGGVGAAAVQGVGGAIVSGGTLLGYRPQPPVHLRRPGHAVHL